MNRISLLGNIFAAAICLSMAGCGEDPPKVSEKAKPWDWEPDDLVLAKGKNVYLQTCYLCHNEGEESAPMLSDKPSWEARLEKGETKMIENAIKGFFGNEGHMPPRGDNKNLSDEEVAAAVKFMVAASQNHKKQ